MTPRPRVLNAFPHPIAVPYSLAFDESLAASDRRWALCFTQYQVLRLVVLAHASQYLRDDIDTTAKAAVKAANEQIAGLKSPMFSNWVTAVRTLPRQWPALKLSPPLPDLVEGLKKLPSVVRPVPDSSGATKLPPLEAIVALRNNVAHGGIPDQKQAERHLAEYLPTLGEVLTAFDFLADCRLLVCDDAEKAKQGLPVAVRTLRGVTPPEPEEVELSPELEAAFGESPAVLVTPAGVPIPLDPLLRPLPHDEPLYLYDGHYGIRVTAKAEAVNRYVYYLGVRDKRSGTPECQAAAERLRELLAARHISYDLPKERVHPWTIAEAALDYSRRTLTDLLGTKYFPECYEPFPKVDDHLDRFLTVPDRKDWKDTTRPRSRNGLILLGTAGSGKTALLARRVEHLLARPTSPDVPADPEADRGNPNVVLFLRGNGIALRPDGVSLFRDVAEKLGVSVGEKGVGSFDELFAHLHTGFVKDQVPGRRLVLVFDALNEAPFAEQITREALQLVSLAARFPWCKVVLSTRDEWLAILPEKMSANEADPRAEVRTHLYDPDPNRPNERRLPAVYLEPLAADHAERIYRNHQQRARVKIGEGYAVPACATPWDDLPADVRKLLTNPLYLYLFQEAFAGRPVGAVAGVPELYAAYVESAYERNIGPAVRAVVEHLCADPDRTTADLTDDDVNALRLRWNAGRTATEIRTDFHPAEMLVHEGFVTKRVREEGGGYRFVYQTVAEYLIYRHLRDEMPPGGDEFAYWLTLAKREKAFPEYAGAVLFLLRTWEQSDDKREWIGKLVEAGSEWTGGVLTKLLDELARVDFVPGQASVRGEGLAGQLAKEESGRAAESLMSAGFPLVKTQFAPTAGPYYRAAADIQARWIGQNSRDAYITKRLSLSLSNLGALLQTDGRVGEAERAYTRSVELREELYTPNPGDADIADGLAASLSNLGNLLQTDGRVGEAERAYTRSVQVYEASFTENPGNVEVACGLARSLSNLGVLLQTDGRVGEAERAYTRSVELLEELFRQNPTNLEVGHVLASALNKLGVLMKAAGRVGAAEDAYRRSVQLSTSLYGQNPGNVEVADELALSLSNLGVLCDEGGREAEAEAAYSEGVQIYEELCRQNPANVDIAGCLGGVLSNLGILMWTAGRVVEAETTYRRSVQIRQDLYTQNPGNIGVADGLANSLNNLGILLRAAERLGEAEDMHTRSVMVREELYGRNPGNVEVATGLANSLCHLGMMLHAAERMGDADASYIRSIREYEELYGRNAGNVEVATGLSRSLSNHGNLLSDTGRVAEADASYTRCVRVYEALYAQNPENVEVADGLAGALSNLGVLLSNAGRVGASEAAYRRSVQIREGLYAHNAGNMEVADGLVHSLSNLGNLLSDTERVAEAETVCRRRVQVYEDLFRRNPNNTEIQIGFADILDDVGRSAQARHLVDEVLAIAPNHHRAKYLDEWLREKGH